MSDDYREPSWSAGRGLEFPERGYEPERRDRARHRRRLGGRVGKGGAVVAVVGILAVAAAFVAGSDSLAWFGLNKQAGTSSEATQTDATQPTQMAGNRVVVPEDNLIAKQAEQWGIETCLGPIVNLSQFLTRNTDSRWLAQRGTKEPNGETFSATIAAKEAATGFQGVSSLFAAPVTTGGCNSAYQLAAYFPAACKETREKVFPSFSSPINLGSSVAEAYSLPNGSARLFLMPAGPSGCVAIKTEIFY